MDAVLELGFRLPLRHFSLPLRHLPPQGPRFLEPAQAKLQQSDGVRKSCRLTGGRSAGSS